MAVKAVYQGAGAYINGVPARDLTTDDWAALTDEQQAAVRATKSGDALVYAVFNTGDAPVLPASLLAPVATEEG